MEENKSKIKDTSYLCGVLLQASSRLAVRDCIPTTTSMPSVACAVAAARRSFAPSVGLSAAAIGSYPTREC
jgi:hypothetical protein